MTFEEIVDQALAMLQRRGRMAYRMLKRQFNLNDDALDDLKVELIEAQRVAMDEDGNVLVWTGDVAAPLPPAAAPASIRARPPDVGPRAYTPPHLTEKIPDNAILVEFSGSFLTFPIRDFSEYSVTFPANTL